MMKICETVNRVIAMMFLLCYSYQLVYLVISLVKRDRPLAKNGFKRYAVLIAARNEEQVIGNLLESIKNQDYPSELVTVFVAADNCTDATARISRDAGAVVYERFDNIRVGKGYALNFLISNIQRDYGEDAFDGYFVFDADNLLKNDYISQMNGTFTNGYDVVTSYRNSKNFGDNWISAGYALWFLRESEYLNHARSLAGTSAAVSGTGFMFSSRILKKYGGWNFFLLTEDIEFTVQNITAGEKIGYCPSAMLYDEQPVKFSQSWRQRMRWAKGYLQVFGKYHRDLIQGMFRKGSFSCYDMSMSIMPAIVLSSVGVISNIVLGVLEARMGESIVCILSSPLRSVIGMYLFMLGIGGITTLTEWRNIHTPAEKKILYTFTFPLFMMTYIPISFAALFSHVEWKPIEHNVRVSIKELEHDVIS